MTVSDYDPLIRQLQTVVDSASTAPTTAHKEGRMAEAAKVKDQLHVERGKLRDKLNKADKWFDKRGGWSLPPKPLPKNYEHNVNLWLQWLKDYERLTKAIMAAEAEGVG